MLEWFQLWAQIPVLGNQWAGWLETTRLQAIGLQASFTGCAGVKYTVLNEDGSPLQTAVQLPQFPGWTWPQF